MRENWLSNRVFKSYEDIVDHCCDAWRKLKSQPWRIMFIGRREWANEFWSLSVGIIGLTRRVALRTVARLQVWLWRTSFGPDPAEARSDVKVYRQIAGPLPPAPLGQIPKSPPPARAGAFPLGKEATRP